MGAQTSRLSGGSAHFSITPFAAAALLLCHGLPATAQTTALVASADLDRLNTLDLSSYLGRAVGGVSINETQGNPFQPDR